MTPPGYYTELNAHLARLERGLEVLRSALRSQDMLTARYAAATVTELGDKIEVALLAIDRQAKALRAPVST